VRRGWGTIFALWLLALVNYLERVSMSFAGPSLMSSLGITPAAFGIILSAFSIGYIVAQVPGGLIADRWGYRLMLVLSPVCWAIFSGLTAAVSGMAAFVVVRVCLGLAEGASNTSVYKAIGDNFDAKYRARVVGLCSTAIPLAPLMAGALMASLLAAFGWRMMFVVLIAPALLAAFISYVFVKPVAHTPRKEPVDDSDEGGLRRVLRDPKLWIISTACFAWNIPYWGFLGWMPSYLVMAHHVDLKALGGLAATPFLFAFLGLVFGGWLGSGRLHRFCAEITAIFFLCAGLGLYIAFKEPAVPAVVAGLSGAAFFLFGSAAPIGKLALDLAPEQHRGAFVGAYNTFGHIGSAIAPAAIGFLVTKTGSFAAGFGLMIAGLLVGTLCVLALGRMISFSRGADDRAARVNPTHGELA